MSPFVIISDKERDTEMRDKRTVIVQGNAANVKTSLSAIGVRTAIEWLEGAGR